MGPATDKVIVLNQASDLDRGADVDSSDIRSGIEATRSGMSETVDAIQAKLSPQNMQETAEQITERAKQAALEVVDQATERVKETVTQIKNEVKSEIHDATIGRVERMVGNVKDTTRSTSSTIVETIKANPIPAALVGIGLAWLFMNKSNSAPAEPRYSTLGYGYGSPNYGQSGYQGYQPQSPSATEAVQQKAGQVRDSVSEAAGHVKDRAGEMVDQAQTKVENLSGRVQDQAQHLSEQVQEQAQRVVYRSQNMIEDNPLMTSALALALGAAVGLLLPETQRENALMGDARDKLVGQVSEAAQDTLGKAQKVATEVLHAAGDKAQEEAKAQGLTSKQPM